MEGPQGPHTGDLGWLASAYSALFPDTSGLRTFAASPTLTFDKIGDDLSTWR